ncbi:response regulator [Alicyclobacillus tolerans]|uniref:Two-component system response regulator NreC n=1 Tax=Alicyclobacillus tolerans TaxID=90970 RepID=A0ABT9LV25_9BACL|nr:MULTISPECIES: response regulator transcription factor [Alicyclobacillus]MDP9728122.1 two-component system response regulator NreC [Alicyclobacillus tengchongensis]QRF23350.1 response regulator transcription factor [Alicyclobacillus sp. TC]
MGTIKVVIVDDHTLVRQGLRLIFEGVSDITVVGEGTSGDEALILAERLSPDVILMDVHMPLGLDGITAARHIREMSPQIRIIMLTMFDDDIHVERMLAAGVDGILFKHDDSTEILEAVRKGTVRNPYLPKRLSQETINRILHKSKAENFFHELSPRETEVLILLANGFTNKEISKRLHISVKTVETHRSNIMKRLNLESRAELVNYALKNGYIESLLFLDDPSSHPQT